MRAHLAERIFFVPYTVVPLLEATYRFASPSHKAAVTTFRAQLRAVERRLLDEGVPAYITLDQMACSIQY